MSPYFIAFALPSHGNLVQNQCGDIVPNLRSLWLFVCKDQTIIQQDSVTISYQIRLARKRHNLGAVLVLNFYDYLNPR